MHAYTDIRMHACMFVGIYIYAYMSVCKYVGMYVHIYACMSLTIITIIHPSDITHRVLWLSQTQSGHRYDGNKVTVPLRVRVRWGVELVHRCTRN